MLGVYSHMLEEESRILICCLRRIFKSEKTTAKDKKRRNDYQAFSN